MTKCLQCRANEARGLEYREQARSQAEMGTEPFLSTLHSVRWEEHRLSLHFKECLHRLPEELDVNGRRSKSEPMVLSQLTHFLPPAPTPEITDMWSVGPNIGSPAKENGGYRQRGDQKL